MVEGQGVAAGGRWPFDMGGTTPGSRGLDCVIGLTSGEVGPTMRHSGMSGISVQRSRAIRTLPPSAVTESEEVGEIERILRTIESMPNDGSAFYRGRHQGSVRLADLHLLAGELRQVAAENAALVKLLHGLTSRTPPASAMGTRTRYEPPSGSIELARIQRSYEAERILALIDSTADQALPLVPAAEIRFLADEVRRLRGDLADARRDSLFISRSPETDRILNELKKGVKVVSGRDLDILAAEMKRLLGENHALGELLRGLGTRVPQPGERGERGDKR
jgi:hypothetical protein